MKLKGTWITIGLILVIGCLSTGYFQTEQIRNKEQIQNTQRVAATAGMDAEWTAPEAAQTSETSEEAEAETESSRELSSALVRLQELDRQIEKNRAGETDATANARKAAADNELRLWESELSRILETLGEVLDEEQKTELMNAQKQWLIDRESLAASASRKQGGALEELEYTMALADAARARAYELAAVYASYME